MTTKTKGCLTIGAVVVVGTGLVWILLNLFFLKRVDAGNVGVLVDYNLVNTSGHPHTSIVLPGNYEWINPFGGQVLFEYPVSQQSLVMAKNAQEGEVQGDDSVTCQDKNGVTIKIDITALWQVDTSKAGTLFFLRPNQPLTGSFNNDVESTVVRPIIRNAVGSACVTDLWDSIGADRASIANQAMSIATPFLANEGIQVTQILVGEPHYSDSQEAAINAKATAQQQAEQAQYLQLKAQYESAAAIAKAQGDAKAIQIIDNALANNPNYMQYLAIQKWDGHLPTYWGGNGQLPFVGRIS